jgi:Histone methylation protein DOT1
MNFSTMLAPFLSMVLFAILMLTDDCQGYDMMVHPNKTPVSAKTIPPSWQAGPIPMAKVADDVTSPAAARPRFDTSPDHQPYHRIVPSSTAGAELAHVDRMLDELYPPSSLPGRNAQSRTDGYWRFIQQGQEPPTSLTYGEFDVHALAYLLEEAKIILKSSLLSRSVWEDCVFTDLGSGTGRMVLAAAALHPWRLCRGIEVLPGIHTTAVAMAQRRDATIVNGPEEDEYARKQPGACFESAVELCCGSFDDDAIYFGDSDFIFSFSTCMNGPTMDLMGRAIRRQCQPGTIVVTTDYRLSDECDDDDDSPRRIQLLREIPTHCNLIGGECTAFLHQVVAE